MAETTYLSSARLAEVIKRLERLGPEDFQAPDADAPDGAVFVGVLTDEQKAMVTLINTTTGAHDALHDELNMPFGGNTNLPHEHRMMHVIKKVVHELLGEDLTHTFPSVNDVPSIIDRDWKIYIVL